jgi:hypothetical protein
MTIFHRFVVIPGLSATPIAVPFHGSNVASRLLLKRVASTLPLTKEAGGVSQQLEKLLALVSSV